MKSSDEITISVGEYQELLKEVEYYKALENFLRQCNQNLSDRLSDIDRNYQRMSDSQVVQELIREIDNALDNNKKVLDRRLEKSNYIYDDFTNNCRGKIEALIGIKEFIQNTIYNKVFKVVEECDCAKEGE